jgi:Kinesin motor domain
MYEVYNDRIFDLLSSPTMNAPQMTTRQGVALQKGMMRRPLLFKNTEMSPERKVVAGLRKIVCGSYEEAMMVLETGLTERRVAGTGSNSVSSRSHGFFCIEVQRKTSDRGYYHLSTRGDWRGSTLSIVDLAGSERARNAKTTGSTLAEAGKINESLMYFGQCLQVQSDCQQDGSKPIVPFRQCKLTELLFSNSFASPSHQATSRMPQKAIMIVTADPQGDFNATSQILRYSALAREVTVPRIPSVTSAIMGGANHQAKLLQSGRLTQEPSFCAEELDYAAHEIFRLNEECGHLAMKLAEEEIRKTEVELRLHAAEERMETIEQGVREECWAEMEERIEEEKHRWREAWEQERLQGEKYVDGKIEIVKKSSAGAGEMFEIHEDALGERIEEVERENEMLRAKVNALEREMHSRSPTKKVKAKGVETREKVVLRESGANSNPFLASLRVGEHADIWGKDQELVYLKMQTHKEQIRVADMSPRKLSLRSSSAGLRYGVEGAAVDECGSENVAPVPVGPSQLMKKQRKLTPRMRDLGRLEDLC